MGRPSGIGLRADRFACEQIGSVGERVGEQAGSLTLVHVGYQAVDQICNLVCRWVSRRAGGR